jgi:hypothetical protein
MRRFSSPGGARALVAVVGGLASVLMVPPVIWLSVPLIATFYCYG